VIVHVETDRHDLVVINSCFFDTNLLVSILVKRSFFLLSC